MTGFADRGKVKVHWLPRSDMEREWAESYRRDLQRDMDETHRVMSEWAQTRLREGGHMADESHYTKLTINLAPDVRDEIQQLADAQGLTLTELIKQAVALDKYVWEHRDGELLVRHGDTVTQIKLGRDEH